MGVHHCIPITHVRLIPIKIRSSQAKFMFGCVEVEVLSFSFVCGLPWKGIIWYMFFWASSCIMCRKRQISTKKKGNNSIKNKDCTSHALRCNPMNVIRSPLMLHAPIHHYYRIGVSFFCLDCCNFIEEHNLWDLWFWIVAEEEVDDKKLGTAILYSYMKCKVSICLRIDMTLCNIRDWNSKIFAISFSNYFYDLFVNIW